MFNNNQQNGLQLNQIYNGDCVTGMGVLMNESIDCIITDPPYLVNYKDRSGRTVQGDTYKSNWLDPACREMFRVLKNHSYAVVFYGANHIEKFVIAFKKAGFRIVGQFAFIKGYSSSKKYLAYNHENAFLLIKGNPPLPQNPLNSVISGWKYTKNEYHPTQKPLNILSMLINAFSKSGDTILDPFMGSGSTAVASLQNNRNYIGFELDTNYHNIAVNRLNMHHQDMQRKQAQQSYTHTPMVAQQPQQQIPQQGNIPGMGQVPNNYAYNPTQQNWGNQQNQGNNQARNYQ